MNMFILVENNHVIMGEHNGKKKKREREIMFLASIWKLLHGMPHQDTAVGVRVFVHAASLENCLLSIVYEKEEC